MGPGLERAIDNMSEPDMKELLVKLIGLMPFLDFIEVVKENFDADDRAELAAQMES